MQIETIKPGCLDPRKLPAKHMQFHAMGMNGIIVHEGRPYNERGEPLPLDLKWLRQNKYHVPEVALKAMSANLAQQMQKPQLKQCSACAIELEMADKFCKGCGQAQVVPIWQPGEGIGDAAKGLVDPDDPLASLTWLLNPMQHDTPRVTAEQMGPTAEDALRGLQDEGKLTIGQTLQGVGLPGVTTGVTTVAPNFGVTPVGTVEYSANIASQVKRQ